MLWTKTGDEEKTRRTNSDSLNLIYEIRIRDGKTLYFNARPVYVSVKTYAAVNEFRDAAYDRICEQDGAVTGETLFVTRNGSEISVRDISF